VLVGAVERRRHLVHLLADGGEDDDADVLGRLVLPKRPRHLPAVLEGHHHVEDDDVRPALPRLGDRFFAVLRLGDLVAAFVETQAEHPEDLGVVVRHEDLGLGRRLRHRFTLRRTWSRNQAIATHAKTSQCLRFGAACSSWPWWPWRCSPASPSTPTYPSWAIGSRTWLPGRWSR